MSRATQLLDLIGEWEARQAAGQAVTPEELCADCPELLNEFKECLQAVVGMNAVLNTRISPTGSYVACTEIIGGPPAALPPVPHPAWPVIPQYQILEELGRGGMGVVFKARQTALGRIVALKTILPQGTIREESRQRFLEEAKAMALLQHPNIVQIYEIGQHDQQPFLVMEYVEGENLARNLAGKPWPPRKAAELVAVLARAIHAAHGQGVVHRDLKPTNILLSADGTPKICDFGLARHFESPSFHTRTGLAAGTPSYMAPEQVLGTRAKLLPTVDVYALGAVLYEAITGRPPFLADNALDTMQLVVKQEPIPLRQWQPKASRDLETICLKCLAKEPGRRYAGAKELAEDLERFLADEPIRARPVGSLERSWRWCRAHPSLTALCVVAAAAVAAVLSTVLVYNHRLSQALERTEGAHRQVLATQASLHRTLTQEIAERVDGDLRELAAVPLAMATLLEDRRNWDEPQIERALKDMLNKSPLIFGLCVAFEPREWRKEREDFALYAFRRQGGLAVKQLLPPAYQPHYRQWEWYRAAKDSPQGRWSEPYIGEGGDRTPMVTFSSPIRQNGRLIGVVAADLAMDYFGDFRARIDSLDVGLQSYCLVVSSGHRILSHREDRYEFPSLESDLAAIPMDESFRDLIRQWDRSPVGAARAVDFSTGQAASFFFYRVPAANWTLLTVVP